LNECRTIYHIEDIAVFNEILIVDFENRRRAEKAARDSAAKQGIR